jgi:hypothetical protein
VDVVVGATVVDVVVVVGVKLVVVVVVLPFVVVVVVVGVIEVVVVVVELVLDVVVVVGLQHSFASISTQLPTLGLNLCKIGPPGNTLPVPS